MENEFEKGIKEYRKCLEDPDHFVNNYVCFLDKNGNPKPYRDVYVIDHTDIILDRHRINNSKYMCDIEKRIKELIEERNITFTIKND
jgi:hypothetical protein